MRRKAKTAEVIAPPTITLHESVPDVAFELALYRMRFTKDSTTQILNDYLRELGA
jgi:hypothetical protein